MKRPLTFFLLFTLLTFATPTKAQNYTDTIRIDVIKQTGNSAIVYNFSDNVKADIEIEWIPSDGGASTRYTPGQNSFTADADGNYTQTIDGNGQVRIYYTYPDIYLYYGDYSLILNEESEEYADIKILFSDIRITSLNVSDCANLVWLDCGVNHLTNLDISGCTKLTYLYCGDNQLTALDVSKNTALTTLWCNENQLSTLDVSQNTALTSLQCGNNQLSTLDVSQNTALTSLQCVNNQLSALDVSQNTALTSLQCDNNQLTALDISKNTGLQELFCGYNQLTDLDVSQNTALTSLQCGNNQLSALDVSQNTALKTLLCNNNQLSALAVSQNTDLTFLNCAHNHLPLSTLYGIYTQRKIWPNFHAANQTDTLVLSACEALDLSSEKTLGDSITTYVLKDEAGNAVSASAYTQDDFSFVFKEAFAGTLTLQNSSIPRSSMTYHITAEACAAEPPTPPTPTETKTDTLRFDVIKETGDSKIEYYFSDKVKAGIEIEWIPSDGGASTRYTPDKNGFTANGVGMYTQTISENGQVRIYYTYAPDAAPYSLGVRNGYTNSNEDISVRCSNNSVTSLNVSGCTHLEDLDCSYNQLTYLDVSSCTDLELLDCTNNQLTYLNVSGCMALKELYCIYNQLTTLDVSGCTDLELLDCTNNQLTTLDVSGCTALTDLECYFNQLTALDVSACTALKELDCKWNQLTTLDASGCTALTKLFCQYNQLTSLDVSQDTALKSLFCDNNHLPLSTLYGIYTQRENWQNFFANNQTDTISLSACEVLDLSAEKMLGGAETAFELKDEASNAVLASAYTEDDFSFVFNDAFAGMLTLQNSSVPNASMTYHITAEECTAEPPTPTTTKTDTIRLEVGKQADNSAIVYNFSDKVKAGIEIEWISEDGISTRYTPDQNGFSVDADGYYQPISENGQVIIYYTYTSEASPYSLRVKKVSRNDKDINVWLSSTVASSLDVRGCTALTDLECNFCVVPSLYVSGCTSLTTLDCSYNNLETLDVSGCTALESLDCHTNQLTTLDVSGCTALNDLNCSTNQLTTLDVSGCIELANLNCYSNKLTSLDASGCTSLTEVTMDKNDGLSNLNVSGCTALTNLQCLTNQLTALNVSGCTSLTELWCDNNQLASLDVSDCVALTDLNCSNNQLTALDVSQNTALTYLNCSDNQLTSLDVRADTALMHLYCGNNQLRSLDVSKNTALVELNCDGNKLKTLDISQDSALTRLACGRNHIPISTLYGIHAQREEWNYFTAANQTDTISVAMCRALDLSSESPLGETATAFVLKDEAGNEVPAGAYTENGFAFQFNNPATYTLTLQNPAFIGIYWGYPSDYITMTYHITTEECLSVSVSANNGAWGWATQTGNGTYKKDSLVTIIATPQEGYRFVNWTREGEVFSINAVYTFAVTENLTLVANFEEIPEEPVVEETFTLYVLANDAAWGSVSQSGNGTYKKDSLATITATPAEGYRFVNWTKADGAVFGTKADTTFKVVENLILVARFEKIPDEPLPPVEEDFTVTLTPNNPAWGLVFKTGNCTYGEGEEITIFALPFAGYRFVNWTKADGSVFGTDSLITFKVTESLELTANFEKIPDVPVPVVDSFSVQVFSNNEAWGSVSQSGDGRYEKDSSVSITATPNEGYRFVNWTKDGAIFTTQADTTFAVTEDLELTANFEKIPDEKPTEDDFHIYVKDNVIYLSENRGKVQVFNVIGQCLYTGNTTAIRVRQTGVYIIAVGGQNYKVLVM